MLSRDELYTCKSNGKSTEDVSSSEVVMSRCCEISWILSCVKGFKGSMEGGVGYTFIASDSKLNACY